MDKSNSQRDTFFSTIYLIIKRHPFTFVPSFSLFFFLSFISCVASSRDNAMEMTALTSAVDPKITLSWSNTITSPGVLYRRIKGSTTWETLGMLESGAHVYTDMTAQLGVTYEYSANGINYSIKGGIVAGINIPLVESRGKVILLVDNTMTAALGPEISQLQSNLVADGWTVYRHDVARETISASSTLSTSWATRIAEQRNIRTIVQTDYNTDPNSSWMLFIIGRIPVPYSGDMAPDGHSAHIGAWPTDSYYADIDGSWTDTTVSDSDADSARNWNVPGDGKFDQETNPSDLEMACGRVDFAYMPNVPTGMSETQLLCQYLVRDNSFRRVKAPYNNVARRGIVDDNFGFGAIDAWTSGFAFFGRNSEQMDAADWFASLQTTPMLFAFGGGSGQGSSASGVGSSYVDFNKKDSKAVFTQLFGSYFGDWDQNDNFLRAPLAGTANSLGLTSIWVSIPLYHMALGDTIGYSVRAAQNNTEVYPNWTNGWSSPRGVDLQLMGDPTLRLHGIAPPSKVTAVSNAGHITLSWLSSSDDAVSGYHVYRATTSSGPFTRITGVTATASNPMGAPLSGTTTSYVDTDSSLLSGTAYTYLVKAVKMEVSPSGSYANQSIGEMVTITHMSSTPATPTRLTVTRTDAGTCVLTWDDNATNESYYRVERYDPIAGTWGQIALLGANVTTYSDSSATIGVPVRYRVRTYASGSNSPYSNIAADYSLPGHFYDTSYSYITLKTAGTFSASVMRYNGSAGSVGIDYATSEVLGTAGTDYTATSSTLTWAHGETGKKSPIVTILNPSGRQTTKIVKLSYSNPTHGLAYNTPTLSYVFITDPTAQILPSAWNTSTMGSIASDCSGYAEYVNGAYGLAVKSGAFTNNISKDSLRFLYQNVAGDFQLTARLKFISTTLANANAGLMVRADSMTSGAVMHSIGLGGWPSITGMYRSSLSGSSVTTATFSSGYVAPYWLRITRSGYVISTLYSSDGTTWKQLGKSVILTDLPSTACLGFYLSTNTIDTGYSLTNGVMGYAQLDNVVLISTTYPAVGSISTFSATTGSNAGDILLNWRTATNASLYQIERSTLSSSGFVQVAAVSDPIVSFTDSGLNANTIYYYRARASNPGNSSDYTPIVSTQPYLPSGIGGWRYINFGDAAIISDCSGDLDVPAGDGISNLLKYALGIAACDADQNPVYASHTCLPVMQEQVINADRYLTCTFTRNTNANDVSIVVEVTSDLNGTWTTINPLEAGNQVSVTDNSPSNGLETIVVKDVQPITESNKRFMRFRVTH